MVAPLVLAAGVTALSNILSGSMMNSAQEEANRINVEENDKNRGFADAEAQEQRDFQERMSNSAYQRATEDMRKAGINPMLAYTQGGASTPSGAMGSSSSARVEPVTGRAMAIQRAIEQSISTAIEQRKLQNETKVADAQVNYNNAGVQEKVASTLMMNNSAQKQYYEAQKSMMELDLLKKSRSMLEKEFEYKESKYDIDKKFMLLDKFMSWFRSGASTSADAALSYKMLIPFLK